VALELRSTEKHEPLIFCDVADGTNCGFADFACPLCYSVGYGEDFRGLRVKQQMVIAKSGAR
jgi:hypothetical protein